MHLALVVARFPTPEQLVLFRVRQKDSTGYLTGSWNDREGRPKPCTTPLSITEAVNPKAWMSLDIPYWEGPMQFEDGVSGRQDHRDRWCFYLSTRGGLTMDLFLVFSILLFIGSLVGVGLMLYAECKKLEVLESYFSENNLVCDNKRFWGRNMRIDRFQRMLLINQLLGMPKLHVKRGDVTEAELASIPISLKRWALWPYRLSFIWLIASVVWSIWYRW